MKQVLSFFSYLFHPLLIPLFTVLLYFYLNFRYFNTLEIAVILGQVGIMTIFIPIACYMFLRSVHLIDSSVMLNSQKQRIIPFAVNIILLIFLQTYVLHNTSAYALVLYFNGLLLSYSFLLLGAIAKQKFSVHATLLSSCVAFFTFMLITLQQPDIIMLVILLLITGITLSSRLYLKAHNSLEIIAGILIGIAPQVFVFFKFD